MSRRYGVMPGKVVDRDDPQGEGRVKVSFPWMGNDAQGYWAPVASLMGGGDRGAWIMPELEDEVLVAFEQGDVEHPYIVGFLHNGEHRPPETDPKVRLLRSVNGHEIALNDPAIFAGDSGGIRIEDAQGNRIELSNGRITIFSVGQIEITAPTVVINGRVVAPIPSPI